MKVVHFIYKTYAIEFSKDENLMVNATQMAQAFNAKVNHFLDLQGTKNFIEACMSEENSIALGLKSKEDLIISSQRSGTWMHKILALKFAAWLDPNFEVWVFSSIETILFRRYKDQNKATLKSLLIAKEKEEMKNQLLSKYPEFSEYFTLEKKLKAAERNRKKIIHEDLVQMKLDFFND